jgi:excisionase family DNA binding protein
MQSARTLTERLFVSVPEAAELLGVDPRTLRRAIEDCQVPASRVGARVLVPTAWLRGQARQPDAAATG